MINLYVISDSSGETANQMANAIMIHFPELKFVRLRFSHVRTKEQVDEIFANGREHRILVLTTVIIKEVLDAINEYQNDNFMVIDLLNKPVDEIEKFVHQKAQREAGLMRDLNLSLIHI